MPGLTNQKIGSTDQGENFVDFNFGPLLIKPTKWLGF